MLHVFPTRDKKPLTPNGLYDALPEDQWEGGESDQWGAPCGEKNGFFVVDVDSKSGGLESASQLHWGDTLKINTPGGGYHVFYKYDPALGIRNGVGIRAGIDVRSEGGYVVVYEEIDTAKILPPPSWLKDFISEGQKKRREILDSSGPVVSGGRNNYLARVAGKLQDSNILTLDALQSINEERCDPPLDMSEVEAIYNSISRYVPKNDISEHEDSSKVVFASDILEEFYAFINNRDELKGRPTGLAPLDDLLGGGKRLGQLTVTAAEAKSGKNTFWHYLMLNWLDAGTPIAYASRELDPASEVLPNLLTLALNQNLYHSDVDMEAVAEATKNWRLAFTSGVGAFDREGKQLFAWMDECRLHGIKYFFIDHLHLLIPNSEDYALVADLCRGLKAYANEHKVHIDLIIQPKLSPRVKQGDKMVKQPLTKDNLRGGANLGQILDSLIVLERQEDDEGTLTNVVKIRLDTARHKLAKLGEFFMKYDRDTMRFEECVDPKLMPKNPIPGTRISPPILRREYPSPVQKTMSAETRAFLSVDSAVSNMVKRAKSPRKGGEAT